MRAAGLVLTLAAGLMAAPAAPVAAPSAPLWQVQAEGSRIDFDYRLNGVDNSGFFASFIGSGRFDPAAPAQAVLTLTIEAGSIDLGQPLFSAFATSAEWFDARNHPRLHYSLTGLVPQGEDRYRAMGEITIRGHTEPLASDVTLSIGDGEARATGLLVLDRTDFGLGVGPSALVVTVDPAVTVRFALVARAD